MTRFVPINSFYMRSLFRYLWLFAALVMALPATAQYYSWGADAPMRWRKMKGEGFSVIAPDMASALAARTMLYAEAVQPVVGEGFRHAPLKMPFVLHPSNAQPNGLVMYMPKRIELLTMAPTESYSMPWLKQLVAHEYRHAVQYGNFNRGLARILSWPLGQQGSVFGLLYMPLWALEGDAVMNETQMSTYGRGLQPSFSMAYRALGEQVGRDHRGRQRKNVDRWFSGSYRDYIPDHYALGYQLSTYAYDRYGENIWDKVGRYGVRNPYVIAATHLGLKRYYQTSVRELFDATFADLNALWAPLAERKELGQTLTPLADDNYTTYRWPMQLATGEVVAIKSDLARATRMVKIDKEGTERVMAHIGAPTSRPELHDGAIYWTQTRRSALFEEQVFTELWRMSLTDEKPRAVKGVKNALYPTSSEEGLAWIEYRPEGRYALVVDGKVLKVLPVGVELHGLAWDDWTKAFYALQTDDLGMSIVRLDREGAHSIKPAAYITLSNLRAADGVLYFGSIGSGLDEVHSLDLRDGKEYRLSQSRYGSFDPMPTTEGLLMTSYDRRGYRVVRLAEPLSEVVERRIVPINKVNPERKGWATINLDTVRFTEAVAAEQTQKSPSKRFSRLLHAANVHSWAPVAYNPFQAVDEHEMEMNIGATLISQNLLSNTEGYLSYGWNQDEGSVVNGGVRYNGLGVVMSLDARYGGYQQFYTVGYHDKENNRYVSQPHGAPDRYYSLSAALSLPLYFDKGSHTQLLSLGTSYSYSNGMVSCVDRIRIEGNKISNIGEVGFEHGLHKLSFNVGFSDMARLAYRDFYPRLGYSLSAGYAIDPSNSNFASLWSLYGSLYLPGFGRHNSIQVRAAAQNAVGGYRYPSGYRPLSFRSSALIPRGFSSGEIISDNYSALAFDYRLPLCYPEWGIPSVLFIKRIRLGLGYDTARYDYLNRTYNIWSAGGELAFDFCVLRMPDSATSTLTIQCFATSKRDMWISASLGLPF